MIEDLRLSQRRSALSPNRGVYCNILSPRDGGSSLGRETDYLVCFRVIGLDERVQSLQPYLR